MLRNFLFSRILNVGPLRRRPMLGQILMLALMLPNSLLIGVVIFIAVSAFVIPFMWLVLIIGSVSSASSSDLSYQCDSALGPDPSVTETAVPTTARTASDDSTSPSDIPTTNPYAELTV